MIDVHYKGESFASIEVMVMVDVKALISMTRGSICIKDGACMHWLEVWEVSLVRVEDVHEVNNEGTMTIKDVHDDRGNVNESNVSIDEMVRVEEVHNNAEDDDIELDYDCFDQYDISAMRKESQLTPRCSELGDVETPNMFVEAVKGVFGLDDETEDCNTHNESLVNV